MPGFAAASFSSAKTKPGKLPVVRNMTGSFAWRPGVTNTTDDDLISPLLSRTYPSTLRTTNAAFRPPNAKLFDSAVRISIGRASFGA